MVFGGATLGGDYVMRVEPSRMRLLLCSCLAAKPCLSNFLATSWTVACQAPLSLVFPMSSILGLPFPSPGDLPDPGFEPRSPALQSDSLPSEPPGKPDE